MSYTKAGGRVGNQDFTPLSPVLLVSRLYMFLLCLCVLICLLSNTAGCSGGGGIAFTVQQGHGSCYMRGAT